MYDILTWPAEEPLPDRIIGALKNILDSGGIIVYPTNTIYGLGASIYSDTGIDRVYRAKKRPAGMPLTVMASEARITDMCRIPDIARPFLDTPDTRITAVLPAENAPASLLHNGTIAVRLPCSGLTESLVASVGPVTSTSANIHGKMPPGTSAGALGQLGDDVDVYIDSGTLPGTPSTIIDFTGERPKVIRHGSLSPEEVTNVYG